MLTCTSNLKLRKEDVQNGIGNEREIKKVGARSVLFDPHWTKKFAEVGEGRRYRGRDVFVGFQVSMS